MNKDSTHHTHLENESPLSSYTVPQKTGASEALEVKESRKSEPCKTLLEGLLKSPLWVIQEIESDDDWWRRGGLLIGWGLLFHAIYGVAIGFFGGWDAAMMAAIKAPLIALFSIGLCLPSLYIFSCIGGMRITLSQTFALSSCVLAIVGLLLIGLTPVAWLFSASTDNVAFTVLLSLLSWLIAVGFALRFMSDMQLAETFRSTIGLKWWLIIYLLVSFQMATTMRPLLTVSETGWWSAEKKFFGTHFSESIDWEWDID